MDFFELKLIEKIAKVFECAMQDRKYNRYQFVEKWCLSETCQAVFDFDETLCSQARSYILRTFENECKNDLPDLDEDSPYYDDDMHWMGYLITYWHFFDGTTGKDIMREFDVRKVLDEFDVLHTLSIKAAIGKIREDDRRDG